MENYPFYPFLSGALVWTALHAINLCSNCFYYEHSGMISLSDGVKDKGRYRTSLSIIRGFLPPKLASEVPSVLYLALELFGEKNRYPRKPMTLPFFIK